MANRTKTPLSITMSPTLLKKLDEQCAEYGMSRSAFVSMAVTMFLKTEEAKNIITQTSSVVDRLNEIQANQQIALWSEGASKKQ